MHICCRILKSLRILKKFDPQILLGIGQALLETLVWIGGAGMNK